MGERSDSWHIPFSSLIPWTDWIDQQWPEGSDVETHAWSGFCGHIEHLQRYKQPLIVPIDKLSQKQLENAKADIVARGWIFEIDSNMLKILEPTRK